MAYKLLSQSAVNHKREPIGFYGWKTTLLTGCVGLMLALLVTTARAAQPSINRISLTPQKGIELELAVDVGENYTFQISTNASDWVSVGGIQNAPASVLTVVDEDSTDRTPARFYRLLVGRFLRFNTGMMHFASAGQFSGGVLVPGVSYPVAYNSYSMWIEVEGDEPFPAASQVFFSGPSGSGLDLVPASEQNSGQYENTMWYQSPIIDAAAAPQGVYTVNYRGTNITHSFTLDALSRLVVPVPEVILTGGQVTLVNWTYHDRGTGVVLPLAPAYMQSIQLQIEGQNGRLYESSYDGDPQLTSHALASPVPWADVRSIALAYDDFEENHYVVFFWKQ